MRPARICWEPPCGIFNKSNRPYKYIYIYMHICGKDVIDFEWKDTIVRSLEHTKLCGPPIDLMTVLIYETDNNEDQRVRQQGHRAEHREGYGPGGRHGADERQNRREGCEADPQRNPQGN